MAHVMVLDSLNEDIFVCGNCKSVFNSLPFYLEHKRLSCNKVLIEEQHLPNNDNMQLETNHNSPCKDALPQDIAESSMDNGDADLTCKVCYKKFKKIKGLLAHIRLHKDKSYQCPICGRCFIQNSHLQRHTLSHKVWPGSVTDRTPKSLDVDMSSYHCPYCNQLTSNYNKLRVHMKCHSALKQYKCVQDGCCSFYDNINTLLGHVSEMHPIPVYTCHICHENFNTLDSVALHQQNHSEFAMKTKLQCKQYKCPQCEAIFKHPEKLSLHMLAESHNKVCTHCNKTFANEKRLRLHLQIHREFKPFVCNICGSSFHMKKYLTTHMLKHGSKNFQCSICNSMFKRQDLLQRHMRLHQSQKMYPCPFKDTSDCKREFSRRDKLTAHLKCHTKMITRQNEQKINQSSSGYSAILSESLDSSNKK